jgi:hypothetical protein
VQTVQDSKLGESNMKVRKCVLFLLPCIQLFFHYAIVASLDVATSADLPSAEAVPSDTNTAILAETVPADTNTAASAETVSANTDITASAETANANEDATPLAVEDGTSPVTVGDDTSLVTPPGVNTATDGNTPSNIKKTLSDIVSCISDLTEILIQTGSIPKKVLVFNGKKYTVPPESAPQQSGDFFESMTQVQAEQYLADIMPKNRPPSQ